MHASWKIASSVSSLVLVLGAAACATGDDDTAAADEPSLVAQDAQETPGASEVQSPSGDPGPSVVINQNGSNDHNINIIGGGGFGHHGFHGHHCGHGHGHGWHGFGGGHHAHHDGPPATEAPAPPPMDPGQGVR